MKRLTLAEMKELQEDQPAFMLKAARELGGVAHVKLLWIDYFLVSEPAVIRELLIHHADQLQRDPFVSRVFKRFMGNGVFVAEGEAWKRQRKLVQPAFHANRIRNYTDTMAQYTEEMVARWQPEQVVVVDRELTQLTLRIIAKTMFDVDLLEQTAEIGRLMRELLAVGEAQLKMVALPPMWLPTPGNRRQKRALKDINALLTGIIRQRQEESVDKGDLLSMLLAARDEEGRPMTERQVLDECITLFVAGHETTAAALTWAWYLLAQNPDVLEGLRAEADAVLGDEAITYEKVKEMPLLEAVVKETMRLYPPAFGFGRTPVEPISAGGYHFPKRSVIMFSTFATHRRPDLWDEPEAFRPERFLDPDNAPDRYTYYPFGVGSRICLGNMFAMLEAKVILATMIRRVRLDLDTDDPVVTDTLITLRPRDPLPMRVARTL